MFLWLLWSLHFGSCSSVRFSHLKKFLHPLWHNIHTRIHENKFSGSQVWKGRQMWAALLTFFSCMMFKWSIKPDMLLMLLAIFHTQVMLRYQFVWDVTLCRWVFGSRCFKTSLIFKCRKVPSIVDHYVISQHWELNTLQRSIIFNRNWYLIHTTGKT